MKPDRIRMDRHQLLRRVYFTVILGAIPLTIVALACLTFLNRWSPQPDILGLTAISTGIIGVLVFFIFLYKFQVSDAIRGRTRLIVLLLHGLLTMALFGIVAWLGFASPWMHVNYWGNYDLETCARSWTIAVIVVGVITLLGSFFDLMRTKTAGTAH